jgi:perosamine synthetase
MLHLRLIFERKVFFSFIQNGPSITTVWRARKNLRDLGDSKAAEYEQSFAKLLGDGSAVSFASGRMAFYAYLKVSGIGLGDEVIIPGFTCSVMVNAILRTQATPIYCDVDRENYGTSSEKIECLISTRTKLIIAQHSFGSACDVRSIISIANKHNIRVLEDCALTLGTTVQGKHVGNFGSAAIFSTDHSKPINTFIGGIFYSENKILADQVRLLRDSSPSLPLKKRKSIFWYFLLERLLSKPKLNRFWPLAQLLFLKYLHLMRKPSPFLNQDISPQAISGDYKYPSRFPEFLAQIGLIEVARWPLTMEARRKNELELIDVLQSTFAVVIPRTIDSTPLRVVFLADEQLKISDNIKTFVDIDSIWFKEPIINTFSTMEEFGYVSGSSKTAEFIAKKIINIPISDSTIDNRSLIKLLRNNVY